MPTHPDNLPRIRLAAVFGFGAGLLAALTVAILLFRGNNESAESLRRENEALRETNQLLEEERGIGPAPEPGDGLLVQTGEIHPANLPAEFDVYFPRPFSATPRLTIKHRGTDLICYELLYQRPDGFRLRVEAKAAAGEPATYEARGLPAADG